MRFKTCLRPGESLNVGSVTIKMVKKSGQVASLVIEAGREVLITGPHKETDTQASMALAKP